MFIFDEHAFGYAVLSLNHVVVSFLSKCSPSFFLIPPEGGLDLVLTGRVPSNRR
jgi:hypothetical protein